MIQSSSRHKHRLAKMLGCYLVVAVTIAVFGMPVVFANLELFRVFLNEHIRWATGFGQYGTYPATTSFPSYFFLLLPIALGFPLYLASILGLLVAIVKGIRMIVFLLLAYLPFSVFLELIHSHPIRYSLILIPLFCVVASFFFVVLHRSRLSALRFVVRSAFVLTLIFSTAYTLAYISVLDPKKDVRVQLDAWVKHNVPAREKVGVVEVKNRLGLYDWRTGEEILETDPVRYVVVPEVFENLTRQFLELNRKGYTYTESDWWPVAQPDATFVHFANAMFERNEFHRAVSFSNKPKIFGKEISDGGIKFDYFWVTHYSVAVYQLQ